MDENEDHLPSMTRLEGDEEVELESEENTAKRIKSSPWKRKNRRTRSKILTPKKLLTRLPILLAQIKAENNSYKSKTEIRQILYLFYEHNKITEMFATF